MQEAQDQGMIMNNKDEIVPDEMIVRSSHALMWSSTVLICVGLYEELISNSVSALKQLALVLMVEMKLLGSLGVLSAILNSKLRSLKRRIAVKLQKYCTRMMRTWKYNHLAYPTQMENLMVVLLQHMKNKKTGQNSLKKIHSYSQSWLVARFSP